MFKGHFRLFLSYKLCRSYLAVCFKTFSCTSPLIWAFLVREGNAGGVVVTPLVGGTERWFFPAAVSNRHTHAGPVSTVVQP